MPRPNPGPLNIYRATTEDLKIKMLLYGLPGAGKTTLALTANDHPDLAPALVLNFEGGLLSVVGRSDVDVKDIESTDDLESVFWYFRENNEAVTRYKTIIVDSGSELYNKALREAIDTNTARRPNRKGDENDIELEDYGRANNIVFRLFSMFRDLPRHVVVTAHPKFVYPPSSRDAVKTPDPTEVRPAFSTTLAQRLEGIFDFVHYLYAFDQAEPTGVEDENGMPVLESVAHRALLTRALGAYHAKTRGPSFAAALGDTVYDPTLPMLYDLLLKTEGGQGITNNIDQGMVAAEMGRQMEAALPDVFGSDPEFDQDAANAVLTDLPEPEAVVEEREEVTA